MYPTDTYAVTHENRCDCTDIEWCLEHSKWKISIHSLHVSKMYVDMHTHYNAMTI